MVHRARDSVIGRDVALKVIAFDAGLTEPERRELATRSEREARAAGALNHPNIVTLYDAGRSPDDESFFIVMEYVEGTTLRQRLASGPLPPPEAARIGRQVADALQYAHERGIVHRDVKPANILMRLDGVVKLADFGIARMESSELTRSGQSMGSPAYMSPEQALGRAVDARSDIFSLGVVLYEMIAGRKPFESDTMAGLCYKIVNETAPPPSRHVSSIPPAWDGVVMRAIAKAPEERFASAAELGAGLRALDPAAAPADSAEGAPPGTIASEPSARRGSGPPTLIPVESGAGGRGRSSRRSRPAARYSLWAAVAGGALVLALLAAGAAARFLPHATVNLDFTYGLKSGDISVSVDGATCWRQIVTGSEESGFREFTRRMTGRASGHASSRASLPEGDHTFTVKVTSGEDTWSDTTSRRLAAGDEATLSIRVRTGLTRGMELEWR